MANPSVTYTLANGTANDAAQVNTNFTDIISSLTDGTKTLTVSAIVPTTLTISSVDIYKALVPIGSIIAHYDFNAALTFDTTYWKYCDGSSATVGGVSRTLPDLSGRYLVGFGGATDGAGDIDTATWATAAVGSSLHQIDISHTHTVPAHYHVLGYTESDTLSNGNPAPIYATSTSPQGILHQNIGDFTGVYGDGLSGLTYTTSIAVASLKGMWTTGAHLTSRTDKSTTTLTTNSTGSATQSIQPRSIQVRFIMRAA